MPLRRCVDRLPSTGATVNPPAAARYARAPAVRRPNASRWSGWAWRTVSVDTSRASSLSSNAAPATTTRIAVSKRSVGPTRVISSVAASGGFPTSRFARRWAAMSIAPDTETP